MEFVQWSLRLLDTADASSAVPTFDGLFLVDVDAAVIVVCTSLPWVRVCLQPTLNRPLQC
jgi:hypothetical protein